VLVIEPVENPAKSLALVISYSPILLLCAEATVRLSIITPIYHKTTLIHIRH
jgi:capsular polysaccharide biosynthesis protein